jgi:hypothetical protein
MKTITFNKIIIAFGIIILINSCGVKDYEETGIIVINNGLDNQVQLRFFTNGLPSGQNIVSKTGKGEVFRGEDTARIVLTHQILQADSIVVAFDNERIETHFLYTSEPKGHSLFTSDSYVHNGNISTYTIDTKNYNNATPCDGPCN